VIYPAGGSSNFRAFADNVSISKLHVKLFFGMLVRIPLLLGRQLGAGLHWAVTGERGGVWGMRFLFAAYRLLGRGVFTVLLYPVVAYFYLTASRARHVSHDYLEAVRTRLVREGRPIPRGMNVFQHVLAFGNGVLDRLAMWAGALPTSSLEFAEGHVLEQFSNGRGVLFIGSHHGNLEVLRAFGDQVQGLKVNALVFSRNSPNLNRVMKAVSPQTLERMIQIDSLGPEAVMMLRDKLEAGEHVAISGDRVSVNHKERSIRVPFLGRPAPFPEGPFVLASLLECPVYLLFCLKIDGKYRVSVEPFADPLVLPRGERRAALERAITRYAERLEAHCLLAPTQWFNFFDFWGQAGSE
jgi:predicted LPLAT superfamily acyltransferase